MADQPIAISDIADPDQIRVKLLASNREVHAPLSSVASASIHGAPAKTTLVDADEFSLWDSVTGLIAKVTWANVKANILAYFNGTAKATPVNADRVWMGNSAASNVPVYSTWTQIKTALFGTAATQNTGTSGATLPFLNGANTWSGANAWSAAAQFNNSLGIGMAGVAVGGIYFYRADNPFIVFYYGTPGSEIAIGQVRASGASGIVGFSAPSGAPYGLSYNPTSQVIAITGSFTRGTPVTKTADFTVAATENHLINNKSGSTCTVTLPAASSFPGREIFLNSTQAQLLVSASSNVVPKAGGAAATSILPATAGAWALLVSDGTNWKIMMSGT